MEIMPNKASGEETWLTWYKECKKRYGKRDANILFVKAWGVRGGKSSPANTAYFRDEMQGYGIKIDGGTAIADILDIGHDVFDSLGNIFKIGKIAVLVTGGIVLLGGAFLIFNIARKPEVAIRAVAATKGM
jgi:hypothetical protein